MLVVALGLAFVVGWGWWYSGEVAPTGAWFAYDPGTAVSADYYVVPRRELEDLLVPLVLVVLWAAASLWLLGLGPADGGDHDHPVSPGTG